MQTAVQFVFRACLLHITWSTAYLQMYIMSCTTAGSISSNSCKKTTSCGTSFSAFLCRQNEVRYTTIVDSHTAMFLILREPCLKNIDIVRHQRCRHQSSFLHLLFITRIRRSSTLWLHEWMVLTILYVADRIFLSKACYQRLHCRNESWAVWCRKNCHKWCFMPLSFMLFGQSIQVQVHFVRRIGERYANRVTDRAPAASQSYLYSQYIKHMIKTNKSNLVRRP